MGRVVVDNRRPEDSDYPTGEPAEMSDKNLIVAVGDYIVNDDGDIMLTTTSNRENYPNEFLRNLNEPYFRAKYLGNADDSLEFANQCRHATAEEIARAQQYAPGHIKSTSGGQISLL